MDNFKSKDRVNIIVGFYNKYGYITKDNVFFRENIEIIEHEFIPNSFCTEEIFDIKPTNVNDIYKSYSFNYYEQNNTVQFSACYNAMIYISKKS